MQTPTLLSKISDTAIHEDRPDNNPSTLYHSTGLGLMVLNKIRNNLRGYTGTRGFSVELFERAVSYDFSVIRRWADYMEKYKKGSSSLTGKNILELGPGSDLGVGLISLAHGAASYHSLDVHHLIDSAPKELYDHIFKTFLTLGYDQNRVEHLKTQLTLFQNKEKTELNYTCDPDFNISLFKDKGIDLIVSNSAFQQFTNVEKSIQEMSEITQSGTLLVSLIDLSTHTRWIRDKDPLNIYRYNDSIYNSLTFKGSPNRVRPYQYQQYLEENGWKDIKIFPRHVLDKYYIKNLIPQLDRQFQDPINQMEYTTIVICATKA